MRRPAPADLATGVLAFCALLITGLLVRREFAPPAAQAEVALTRDVSDWPAYAKGGQRIGATLTPVTIVEFADFQCPFCRQSAREIAAIVDSLGGQVAHVYRHFPLSAIHPRAMMAAVASECAAKQGRFRAYHDRLFAKQDSLGQLDWIRTAIEAGVGDTTAFSACVRDSSSVTPRIRADMAAASKLGIRGTPALLVNGTLFSGVPTEEQLRDLVRRALRDAAQD